MKYGDKNSCGRVWRLLFNKTQVPEAARKMEWRLKKDFTFAGIAVPNLDITETYEDEAAYLHYHYTSQGQNKKYSR